MTAEEFKDTMASIAEVHAADPEVMHGEADDLLCDLLKELGYGEGIAIYEKMEKWYA